MPAQARTNRHQKFPGATSASAQPVVYLIAVKAESVLCGNPDYENLKSLPGIGPVIALTILAEAGDVRRFRHHRQFLKYCGFDLAKNQSGVTCQIHPVSGVAAHARFGSRRVGAFEAKWVALSCLLPGVHCHFHSRSGGTDRRRAAEAAAAAG